MNQLVLLKPLSTRQQFQICVLIVSELQAQFLCVKVLFLFRVSGRRGHSGRKESTVVSTLYLSVDTVDV